jgi:hypothetical protein
MAEAKKSSLTVLGGPLAGARCVLPDSGVVTLGSDEGSSLVLALPGVGPLHAQVVVEPGSVTVYEEGEHRVFVNDSPVGEGGTLLHNGDVVWLGSPGDDDAVMLQCLLPRRPIEQHTAVTPDDSGSPEATLAAIPLPAETFTSGSAPPEAAHAGAGFALLPEEQQAETVVLQGDRGEELVFAEDTPAAEPIYAEAIVEPEPVAEDAGSSGPHVVVPDFESVVFVETPPSAEEVQPEYAPVDEGAFDAGTYEQAVPEEPAEEVVVPPPQPIARPHVPPPPRTASPEATHPPQARGPHATHPPQARSPQATHPPQGHPPYATLAGGRRARKPPSSSRGALAVAGGVGAVVVVVALGWAGWKYVWPRFAAKTSPVAVVEPTPQPIPSAAVVHSVAPATTLTPTVEQPPVTAPPAASPAPSAAAPAATPTPRTTPSPSPRVTPSPRTTPTPASATAHTGPPPTTTAAAPSSAAQAQTLVTQAEAALTARQYEAAIGNADAALRLDPGNARAGTVKADATKQRDLARRRFVSGRTVVQTQKAGSSDLSGFDSGGADIRKAPDFQGRIEFEMSPSSGLDAGTSWQLRIFVVNEGKKSIRVQGLTVTTTVNGAPAGATVPPAAREIAPQQRALVGETSGTWREGTTSWTSEAAVTANKGDSLRNTLTWR